MQIYSAFFPARQLRVRRELRAVFKSFASRVSRVPRTGGKKVKASKNRKERSFDIY